MSSEKPYLIIGPLPPPFGGARVSFKLFLDYVKNDRVNSFRHFDLPIRKKRDGTPPGNVVHYLTVLNVIKGLFLVPFSGSIILFGSRNFCFSYGLLFIVVSKIMGKNCFVRFFGGRPVQAVSARNGLLRHILLKGIELADKIIIETEFGAREFPKTFRSKIEVIPGYRTRWHHNTTDITLNKRTIRFVYMGGITKEKGIDLLLKAFAQLRSEAHSSILTELHLYGTGSSKIIQQAETDRDVYYHGQIDNSALRKRLPSHDVFVFPSVYNNEGHPGAIIEALMAGLPVIANDLAVIREILTNKVSGLLVKPGDVRDLSEAMKKLTTDAELRSRLAKGAFLRSSDFDAAVVLPKLANALGLEQLQT